MSDLRDLRDKIIEAREHLDMLESKYIRSALPCCNKGCAFFREDASLKCTWTVLVEECREYEQEV
jgi:hypothetical protein